MPVAPPPKPKPKRVTKRKARVTRTQFDDPPPLVGLRLVAVRPMTSREVTDENWDYHRHTLPVALVFENGVVLFAAKNPYGDGGPGTLVGNDAAGRPIQFRSVPEDYRGAEAPPWPRDVTPTTNKIALANNTRGARAVTDRS